VSSEQIDDLALALVAPLGADDHRGWHRLSVGPDLSGPYIAARSANFA
jgi:hypothetical protein